MKYLFLILLINCVSSEHTEQISQALSTIAVRPACSMVVTDGATAVLGSLVDQPGMRATVTGSNGNAAMIVFTYRGTSTVVAPLASGEYRRQLGLKLHSADPCNLVYLMWRLDPNSTLEAQVKTNPIAHDSATCGAGGYVQLGATVLQVAPTMALGALHSIRAEIVDTQLHAWIDDGAMWSWNLTPAGQALRGVSGIRSDNVQFDLLSVLTD